MKIMIVKSTPLNNASSHKNKPYKGIERPKLGSFSDVSEEIIYQAFVLEDLSPQTSWERYKALLSKIREASIADYELIVIGPQPPADCNFLGYDVGENKSSNWSAILHREDFLSLEEIEKWEGELNSHGLFQESKDAEAFLNVYLDSDEPDRGWSTDGWTENPDWYKVIPIYTESS